MQGSEGMLMLLLIIVGETKFEKSRPIVLLNEDCYQLYPFLCLKTLNLAHRTISFRIHGFFWLLYITTSSLYSDSLQLHAPELFAEGGELAFFMSRGSVFLGFNKKETRPSSRLVQQVWSSL